MIRIHDVEAGAATTVADQVVALGDERAENIGTQWGIDTNGSDSVPGDDRVADSHRCRAFDANAAAVALAAVYGRDGIPENRAVGQVNCTCWMDVNCSA